MYAENTENTEKPAETKKPKVIVVEGIIGAGKTTLIDILKRELERRGFIVTIIREPVDQWKELLVEFYKDPARYSYLFQTQAFHDRVYEGKMTFESNPTTDVFIAERSVFTDTIFMRMLHDDKCCTDLEYQCYIKWWKMWKDVLPFSPDMFIYLKPSIFEAMFRIALRARDGESLVSIDYQTRLGQYHDRAFDSNPVICNTTINNYGKNNKKNRIVEINIKKSTVDLASFLPEANHPSCIVPILTVQSDADFASNDSLSLIIDDIIETLSFS